MACVPTSKRIGISFEIMFKPLDLNSYSFQRTQLPIKYQSITSNNLGRTTEKKGKKLLKFKSITIYVTL